MRATYPDARASRINPEDAKGSAFRQRLGVDRGQARPLPSARPLSPRHHEGRRPGADARLVGFPEQDGNAPHLFSAFDSNINNLTENCNPGPYSFGADFRSTLCRIYPCTPENSAVMPGTEVVVNGGFTKNPEYGNPAVAAYGEQQ